MSHVLSAYHDNSAVMSSFSESMLEISGDDVFKQTPEKFTQLLKLKHTTTLQASHHMKGLQQVLVVKSRDCSATGRVARPKAGFMGLCLSHLRLTEDLESWETNPNKPDFLSSPMEIIRDAP